MKAAGAIIVAAGSGLRFGAGVPKQFLPLRGKPVFSWSIKAFKNAGILDIVVVVPPEYLAGFLKQQKKFGVRFAAGGKERYHSVRSGLKALPENVNIVAIHDGARPLIKPELITASILAAAKHGAAIAAVQSKDTVKISRNGRRVDCTAKRSTVWLAQTPQAFRRAVIEKAYSSINLSGITDDAQAAELAGYPVALVQGDHDNFKITHKIDLKLADLLLKTRGAQCSRA
jgi:2-C-methyl-D-erythritol 4-phosphate cytidylyltransferase